MLLTLEPPRHRAGHPDRRGRARLHERDLGAAQARGEPGRQRQASPQRMLVVRQVEMLAAQAQQLGHQQCRPAEATVARAAGCDHGLRSVERGAGEAAAGERRHDLKQMRRDARLWQVTRHEQRR